MVISSSRLKHNTTRRTRTHTIKPSRSVSVIRLPSEMLLGDRNTCHWDIPFYRDHSRKWVLAALGGKADKVEVSFRNSKGHKDPVAR